MPITGITYDIRQFTDELQEIDGLYYIDRLNIDADTASVGVDVVLDLGASSFNVGTVTTAARVVTEVSIDRVGPLQKFHMVADFLANAIKVWGLELFIRPLTLGMNILPGGQRVVFPGGATALDTQINFDINPFSIPADARVANPIIDRLYLDLVTVAEAVTPTLVFTDGTTLALAAVTQATRGLKEYAIGSSKRLRQLQLAGDFTNTDIVLYDVEIDLVIPQSQLV